jgi:hypothetical protein
VASALGGVYAIDEPLMAYRQHDENVVGARPYDSDARNIDPLRAARSVGDFAELYRGAALRALALERAGVSVPRDVRRLLLSRFDPGMGLAFRGLRLLGKSPPLGRTMVKAGIGKMTESLFRRRLRRPRERQ